MQMTRNSPVSHRGNVLCHTYVRGDAKKVVEVGCSYEGTLPKGNVVIEGKTIQSVKDVTFDHIEPYGSTVVDPSGESHRRPRLHRGGHGISTTLWYSGWNSPISKTALIKWVLSTKLLWFPAIVFEWRGPPEAFGERDCEQTWQWSHKGSVRDSNGRCH